MKAPLPYLEQQTIKRGPDIRTCDDCGTALHWAGSWLQCGTCNRYHLDTSHMGDWQERYIEDLKRSKQSS